MVYRINQIKFYSMIYYIQRTIKNIQLITSPSVYIICLKHRDNININLNLDLILISYHIIYYSYSFNSMSITSITIIVVITTTIVIIVVVLFLSVQGFESLSNSRKLWSEGCDWLFSYISILFSIFSKTCRIQTSFWIFLRNLYKFVSEV